MNRIKRFFLLTMVALGLSSCTMLEQMSQMANFANCTFDFNGVNSVEMLGMNLRKGMTRDDLSISQAILLTKALINKSLPVTFNIDIDVTNPNSSPAAMTKMDYIITLNERQIISTSMDRSISVDANSKNTVTIPVTFDLFELFSGESADAIVNLGFKLAGTSSDPVTVGVKLKPYITVGNRHLAYPDYITLRKVLQ